MVRSNRLNPNNNIGNKIASLIIAHNRMKIDKFILEHIKKRQKFI